MSRLGFVSFDVVPGLKGAPVHIEAFAKSLSASFGGVDLLTPAGVAESPEVVERWPGVFHTEIAAPGKSLIDRVLAFQQGLAAWIRDKQFDVLHFRSPFEGFPLLRLGQGARFVFEVNGLPSIELEYRYPQAAGDDELMRKLTYQERACLQAADVVITPSAVTKGFLIRERGCAPGKVRVIPNGADPSVFVPGPERTESSRMQLLYFGTLASWQGVDLAVRALAQVDAELTIVGVSGGREREAIESLARKLGLAARVRLLPPMLQNELAGLVGRCDAVVAPLAWTARNVVQGCCPLKIIEAMVAGVPVIASDLAVVRELGSDGTHFLLVKPGSVDAIAAAVLRLQREPALRETLGGAARAHVLESLTWDHAGRALVEVYRGLLTAKARALQVESTAQTL